MSHSSPAPSQATPSPATLGRALAICVMLLGVACGSEPSETLRYSGEPGTPTSVTFSSDVPLVTVTVNQLSTRQFLLDTGSPATLLDNSSFGLSLGVFTPDSFDLLGISVHELRCGALDLFDGELLVGGIVGGDILKHFAVTLDYRGELATLWEVAPDPPAAASAVDPAVTIPFELRGGGILEISASEALHVGATRVVVPLRLDGHAVYGVLDTGASLVVLSETLYDTLLADQPQRPVLSGLKVLTVDGARETALTRVARFQVETLEATSIPVMIVRNSLAFSFLSSEVDRPIDVLLGASFLRAHQLTIDYPARRLILQRYSNQDHIAPLEYVGVGFSYAAADGGAVVIDSVFLETDAYAQGLQEGDLILTADEFDISLTGLGGMVSVLDSARQGDRVAFTIGRGASSIDVDVLVEDLLPHFE